MCADCTEPATHDAEAGWVRIGDQFVAMTRPLCDFHAIEDARERAEARAS